MKSMKKKQHHATIAAIYAGSVLGCSSEAADRTDVLEQPAIYGADDRTEAFNILESCAGGCASRCAFVKHVGDLQEQSWASKGFRK
jgi:hypothetical protein